MNRRCLNCMNMFQIPSGCEEEDVCCPFCGYVENTPPDKSFYLHPGVLIRGRYLVGTVIGAGGFGVTYKAWDNTLDSIIALKEYYPDGVASRTDGINVSVFSSEEAGSYNRGKERFLKEARSLAKFNNNPGTVTIYDFFELNGTAYITMEYLDGYNLREYLQYIDPDNADSERYNISEDDSKTHALKPKESKSDVDDEKTEQSDEDKNDNRDNLVPVEMIVDVAVSVCDTLSIIHSTGVVHRDISPENIFKCSDGTYKLIDFGAAKQQLSDEKRSSTVILKHAYAPVEQFSQMGDVGPWTDIYSLGATLYKLSTGITPRESIQRILNDDIEEPRAIRPDIPEHVSLAIMKALSIQIKDRYQSAQDFKTAILGDGTSEDYKYSRIKLDEKDGGHNKKEKGMLQEERDMGVEFQEKAIKNEEPESMLDISAFLGFDDTEVSKRASEKLEEIKKEASKEFSEMNFDSLSSMPQDTETDLTEGYSQNDINEYSDSQEDVNAYSSSQEDINAYGDSQNDAYVSDSADIQSDSQASAYVAEENTYSDSTYSDSAYSDVQESTASEASEAQSQEEASEPADSFFNADSFINSDDFINADSFMHHAESMQEEIRKQVERDEAARVEREAERQRLIEAAEKNRKAVEAKRQESMSYETEKKGQTGILEARRQQGSKPEGGLSMARSSGNLSMSSGKKNVSSRSAVIQQQTNILRANDEAAKIMAEVEASEKAAEKAAEKKGIGSLFGKIKKKADSSK